MFARYTKKRESGKDHFLLIEENVSLFGCREGYIPWLLDKQIPADQGEPFPWHISIESAMAKTEYPGTLVIDLKPKQHNTNVSLYEVLDVWGYSAGDWTPILLHLSGLFVDADPKNIDRKNFTIKDEQRDGPIYEFLYLVGSVSDGKLAGKWITPPASPTNAALLWPESLRYFVDCIRDRTPQVLSS